MKIRAGDDNDHAIVFAKTIAEISTWKVLLSQSDSQPKDKHS